MSRRALTSLRRRLAGEQGLTLTELLIVAVIGLVVLGASMMLLTSVGHSEKRGRERAAAVQQARTLVERVTRDLREGQGVEEATSTTLTLLTWVRSTSCDSGGVAESSIQCQVSYTCAGGTCTRSIGPPGGTMGSPETVITGLAGDSIFSYAPDTSNPTWVGVRLEFLSETAGEDSVTLEDGVALRNVQLGA